jgi:hypothetical protein
MLYNLYEKLAKDLGEIFNSFYGYIFEDIVNDLKALKVM